MKKLNEHIKRLVELARAYDEKGIKEEFKRIVPEYTPFEMEKQESEIEGQRWKIRKQTTDDGGGRIEGIGKRIEDRGQRN